MAKFAIVGSSYVERLRKFTHGDLRVPGEVKWFGVPGLRTDSIPQHLLPGVIAYNPDCVFIHVGGNDIISSTVPRDVFLRLMNIRESLLNAGVKCVYVSEVMTRGNFERCPDKTVTKALFDRKRKKINNFLRSALGKFFVVFKDIQFPTDFDKDQVHLGSVKSGERSSGMCRYMFRIRRVFLGFRHSVTCKD